MKTEAVVIKVVRDPRKPWWVALGLPPPWKWGDDVNLAYVVKVKPL